MNSATNKKCLGRDDCDVCTRTLNLCSSPENVNLNDRYACTKRCMRDTAAARTSLMMNALVC